MLLNPTHRERVRCTAGKAEACFGVFTVKQHCIDKHLWRDMYHVTNRWRWMNVNTLYRDMKYIELSNNKQDKCKSDEVMT